MENQESIVEFESAGIRNSVLMLLFASIAAFFIHAQFEAWLVGVGSIQLPLFFFYLGSIIPYPDPVND